MEQAKLLRKQHLPSVHQASLVLGTGGLVPMQASSRQLGHSLCPVMELSRLYAGVDDIVTLSLLHWCHKTRQMAWDCPGILSPSCLQLHLKSSCPGRQLLPLWRFQTTVTPPGVVSMFCCELTPYFKVELCLIFISSHWISFYLCQADGTSFHFQMHGTRNSPYRSDQQVCCSLIIWELLG